MDPAAVVTSIQEGLISHILSFPLQCRMVQHTFRSAIGYCSNIPDLKKIYSSVNFLVMVGQWYNKDINDG